MSLRVNFNILNQKGTPAFYSDTFANRPTYGYAGRVFISTDTGQIFEDTGSAWTLIADAGVGGGTLASVTANGNTTASGIVVTANGISSNVLTINGNGTTTGDALLFPQFSASNTTYADRTTIWALNRNVLGIGFSQAAGSPKVINFNSDLLTQGVTQTYYLPSGNGALALGQNGITGYNSNPNTAFTNSQFYSGLTTPTESHTYNIGVTGTALATSADTNRWGVGVYGAGYTNGGTRSAGVQGDGEVTLSSDTGSAIGVRGYATSTHSGGLNIGILGDASGSSTGNYGVYTNMASASNTFANYHLGTAISYFGGNVGVNNTSPSLLLSVVSTDNTQNSMASFAANNLTQQVELWYGGIKMGGTAAAADLNLANKGAANMLFSTNSTERMRISSGGNVLIGGITDTTVRLSVTGSTSDTTNFIFVGRDSGGNGKVYFRNDGQITFTNLGTGTVTATSGVLSTVSDMNLKLHDAFIDNALDKVLKLIPRYFYWKQKSGLPINIRQLGFYAQEVNEALGNEAANKPINNENWGITDRSIIAMLTKAIQELNEKLVRNNIN